jgi:predicted N-acetyltransferase YhbS
MTVTDRPFRSDADYAAMQQLAGEIIGRAGLPAYFTAGDMDWWRGTDSDPAAALGDVQLWWTEDGRLVAFAWPADDQVDILIHPEHPGLFDRALAWAETHYCRTKPEGSEVPLRAWAYRNDKLRTDLLTARGYQRTDGCMVNYGQPLLWAAPAPALPPGYNVTTVQSVADIADRAAVQRAAFESEFMTVEKQRAVMATPTYRPELDLVIRAPDGRFAAFALIWLDAANHLGVFEPVGVAVEHQRRGLGRAIMMAGLRLLHQFGAHRAVVQTGLLNEPARALYESVGFVELDRCYAWVAPKTD